MNKKTKIFIAGHKGMVGSSLLRVLTKYGYKNIFYLPKEKLNFENSEQTMEKIGEIDPDIIIIAAAKVGGINANSSYPYEFIKKNLAIQMNIIEAGIKNNVKRLIFLGSSCVYPKFCSQPISENSLLSGELEFTNRPYAIAKIAGIETCASLNRQYKKKFLSLMPCNLFGPKDNYDLKNSHVIPALIKKFHQAKIKKQKQVKVWGSGKALREFMYVDDLSEAILFILELNKTKFNELINFNSFSILNIGSSEEISIRNLSQKIAKLTNYSGKIKLDKKYPDGTPRKILDSNKINQLGWKCKFTLDEGLKITYKDFVKTIEK